MKALISPNEIIIAEENGTSLRGCRIVQVEADDKIFLVAPPLEWVNCPDECIADLWFYHNGQAKEIIFSPRSKTAEENKQKAKIILDETSIYVMPDYSGANKQDWLNYRSAIFAIWENPQEGNLTWPTKPS